MGNTGLHCRRAATCLLVLVVLLSGCYRQAFPGEPAAQTGAVTPVPTAAQPLSGLVIGIDPGHQAKPDYSKEPNAPGSKTMKSKVSAGTLGFESKVPEYEINLAVGLKLKSILEALGATVVMTREDNDVSISNIARAQLFNERKTDYAIRLHANSRDNRTIHGAFILIPSKTPHKAETGRAAALLLSAYCARTGAASLGIVERADQTGFNFCERLILNIEMGHLSNRDEELRLIDPAGQQAAAQGIADGIVAYFAAGK
jgi:N-acetylmuramoyl-L-alanine amidase